MNNYIFLIIIFLISWLGTALFRWYAIRRKIIDVPNYRSSHSIPTPRGGGVAIVLAWYVGITWLFIQNQIDNSLYYAFLSGLILVVVGLLDDIMTVPPIIRLTTQGISAGLALYFLGGLKLIQFGIFDLDQTFIWTPIAFIAIVWFINLYNFMDGIDGYAALESIFFTLFMYFLYPNSYLLVLAIAVIGFLIWNWHPAKIFMGDAGSTLLGFNIIIIALYFQNTNEISLLIPIIVTGVFWFDATLTLIRRYKNKEKLSQAHRKHAFQRAVQSGYKHSTVTLGALGINLVLAILSYIGYVYQWLLLPVFAVSIVLLSFLVRYIDSKKAFAVDNDLKNN
jgi:Fuc2NAc and GlcNAc transferase